MGVETARLTPLPRWRHDEGPVPDAGMLPVLPALRSCCRGPAARLGGGGRGWNLLCLALAAGASALALVRRGRAAGVRGRAAAGAGMDPGRMLLVPEPGPNWPQVVVSLLDGCELVVLGPPGRPPAQARRQLEATVRRFGGVLLVAGDWEGAQVRLIVTDQEWTGIGAGHGRLRARRARVVADGRGGRCDRGPVAVAARPRRLGDRRG